MPIGAQETPVSFGLRVRAAINRVVFPIRRRMTWGRRSYCEAPAQTLPLLTPHQQMRVQHLQQHYGVRFEAHLNAGNSLESYALLDQFQRAQQYFAWQPPTGQCVLDVGSRNFYYARALQAAWQPVRLTGIELDGYRLYENFHTRASHAAHYIRELPQAEFLVQDLLDYHRPADGVLLQYPFIVPEPLLHYGLPLSELKPRALLTHAARLLPAGGWLWMINKYPEEFSHARDILQEARLRMHGRLVDTDGLIPRETPPIVSLWVK